MIVQVYLKKNEIEELSALQYELLQEYGIKPSPQKIIKAVLRKFLFEELEKREDAKNAIRKYLIEEK